MNLALKRLLRFYTWMTVFYPYEFRQEFVREFSLATVDVS